MTRANFVQTGTKPGLALEQCRTLLQTNDMDIVEKLRKEWSSKYCAIREKYTTL